MEERRLGVIEEQAAAIHLGVLRERLSTIRDRLNASHAHRLRETFSDMVRTMIRLEECPQVKTVEIVDGQTVYSERPLIILPSSDPESVTDTYIDQTGNLYEAETIEMAGGASTIDWEHKRMLSDSEVICKQEAAQAALTTV